ncbi:unnamed protein product, partial [Didymodactylos carnosus]
ADQLEQARLPENVGKDNTRDVADRVILYRAKYLSENETGGGSSLDSNHTHFILLDQNNKEWNRRTGEFLAAIEQEARKQFNTVPMVQIVANGGPLSILRVCRRIRAGIPLVVIKESGRVADIIAEEYEKLYGKGPVSDDEVAAAPEFQTSEVKAFNNAKTKISLMKESKYYLENKLYNADKEILKFFTDETKNPEMTQTIRREYAEMITSTNAYYLIKIFQFRTEHHEYKLNDAMLEVLLREIDSAKPSSDAAVTIENSGRANGLRKQNCRNEELRLAMAWNKFDLVSKSILNDKTIVEWKENELDQGLADALRLNSVQFTDLLIKYGASYDRVRRLLNLTQTYLVVKNRDLLPLHKNENYEEKDRQYEYYTTYLEKHGMQGTDYEQVQ